MIVSNCPYCGGKAVVNPFIYQVKELPKPMKLFGSWDVIYAMICDVLGDRDVTIYKLETLERSN